MNIINTKVRRLDKTLIDRFKRSVLVNWDMPWNSAL